MYGIKNFSKLPHILTKSNSAATVIEPYIGIQTILPCIPSRFITNSIAKCCTDKSPSASNTTPNIGGYDTLTEYHAYDMIHRLSDNDRASLSKALSKYNSDKIKSKFQGKFLVYTIYSGS